MKHRCPECGSFTSKDSVCKRCKQLALSKAAKGVYDVTGTGFDAPVISILDRCHRPEPEKDKAS